MEPYITPLILLALVTTGGYFWGRKKNRWIGAWIARETEAALQPRETEYVNIGGCIGYHLTYALAAPFREAKGTFALLPRHSLLYLPISFLIRRHDRFFLQLFTDERLPGEAHIGPWQTPNEVTARGTLHSPLDSAGPLHHGRLLLGRKKNRWIGAWIARESEAALQPRETEYVNIGGCIGYHFTYALAAPFREAKGTFALLPRHSLLYLPIPSSSGGTTGSTCSFSPKSDFRARRTSCGRTTTKRIRTGSRAPTRCAGIAW